VRGISGGSGHRSVPGVDGRDPAELGLDENEVIERHDQCRRGHCEPRMRAAACSRPSQQRHQRNASRDGVGDDPIVARPVVVAALAAQRPAEGDPAGRRQ
jgi:hypothetical protein